MKRTTAVLASSALISASLIGYDAVSYAATGQSMILGKKNTAGTTTTLVSNNGAALSLVTKAGKPPLKVNRKARVANLNADLLDGKDSVALGTQATRVTISPAGAADTQLSVPLSVTPGTYQVSYSVTLSTDATGSICTIRQGPSSASYSALSYGAAYPGLNYRSHQASNIITVASTDVLQLRCSANSTFNFATGNDTSYVKFVRVDSLTPANEAAGRTVAGRSAPGAADAR